MWPWIKRFRDWAISDLWPLHRIGSKPQVRSMHYSYEKAGVIVDDQPIPWNAEAVVVEALLRLPNVSTRQKTDFTLRLPGRDPCVAESLRPEDTGDFCRLFFRFPPPIDTTTAELLWRGQSLKGLPLPTLGRVEFIRGLRLQSPTLSVILGQQTVACQTFVSTQCRGLVATALLTSATSLAPIVDLNLRVELQAEPSGQVLGSYPVQLTSSQLRGKQA